METFLLQNIDSKRLFKLSVHPVINMTTTISNNAMRMC